MIIPRLDADITNDSTMLYIRHDGGDPLRWGTFIVRVDGIDRTGFCSITGGDGSRVDDGVWYIGETVFDPGTGEAVPPDLVQIIYTGDRSPVLLFSKELDPGRQLPIPTFPTVPPTMPTTTIPTLTPTFTPTPTPGTPPTAAFTMNATEGTAPLAIRFSDGSTGSPTVWEWSFGDGSVSIDHSPVHTYTTPGTYAVNQTVRNPYGSATATGIVRVSIAPPDTGSDVYLLKNSGSWHVQGGTWLQFRATDVWGKITVGKKTFSPWPNETVRLEIRGNQQGWINMSATRIDTFEFDDVTLYIEGERVAEGRIRWNRMDIIGYRDLLSTLTLQVDEKKASTTFRVDGTTLIEGMNASALVLTGLTPDSRGVMQLNPDSRPTNSVEYIGSVERYEIRS